MPEPILSPDRLAGLVEAAAEVAEQTDLTAALRSTVETAMEITGARYGALGVLGEHGTLVEFIHRGMLSADAARVGMPPVGRGLLGTITRMGKTVRIDRIDQHPDAVGFPDHHPFMTTFLGVPIRVGKRVFGNLYLTDKEDGFTEQDEALVESLAVIAGAAVSNARLHERLRRVAVVEDRERIARDLHDAIIQELFAVGLLLQGMSQRVTQASVQDGLIDAVERLDNCITSLRKFIFDLRPPVWTTRNLRTELTDLVAQLAAPHPVDSEVTVEGGVGDLPAGLVEDAVQIAREAVSNALRHAGATNVRVRVRTDGDQLTILVEDDGSGFDPGATHRGMGLTNLRSRAEGAGGSLSIESDPERGTRVQVTLPT